MAALKHFGAEYTSELQPSDFDDSEGAIRIVEETESCQLDLFTRITGGFYENVFGDAEIFNLNEMEVRYASKDALIAWKEKSVRDKDRLDALAPQTRAEEEQIESVTQYVLLSKCGGPCEWKVIRGCPLSL